MQEQDEADTDSEDAPAFVSIFDLCKEATSSKKGGFFNNGNMRPESIPSAKHQSDGYNCGVYSCLAWTMFVAIERDQPELWIKIDTLADLDLLIVKPFWELHDNKEDRMLHFCYRLCRLMEYFLDKRLKKQHRSRIALGRHPLPDDWVYPKKLSQKVHLPPCAGGPIPFVYSPKSEGLATEVKAAVQDEDSVIEESDEIKQERNERHNKYLIMSFVDLKGTAQRNLERYGNAFEIWVKNQN